MRDRRSLRGAEPSMCFLYCRSPTLSAWAIHSPSQCFTTARQAEMKTSCCRLYRTTLTWGQESLSGTCPFLYNCKPFIFFCQYYSEILFSFCFCRELGLKRPIYQATACYGHFGREEFPWEKPKSLVFWVAAVKLSGVQFKLQNLCIVWMN